MLKLTKLSRFVLKAMLILILSFSVVFFFASPAQAAVDLHLKVEVSNDNGVTWHTYGGTEFAEGITLTGNPGETFSVQIKIWNTGDVDATDVTGSFTINYAHLITSYDNIALDADNNGTFYSGDFIAEGAEGQVSLVAAGTTEETAETLTLDFTLASSFPEGQTVLVGQGRITAFTPFQGEGISRFNDQESALADAANVTSNFRVAVGDPIVEDLVETGPSPWNYGLMALIITGFGWLAVKKRRRAC